MSNKDEVGFGTDYGIVLYTDGSAKTDRPLSGWGVHGYIYPVDEPKRDRFTKKKDAPGTLGYFDARKGSKEYKVGDRLIKVGVTTIPTKTMTGPRDLKDELPVEPILFIDYCGGEVGGTVSTAEMRGMEVALDIIIEREPRQSVIRADSEYVIKTILDYYHLWKLNSWTNSKGVTPPHLDTWHRIIEKFYKASQVSELRIIKVAGHAGEHGNEKSDTLAYMGGILAYRKEPDLKIISPARGYKTTKKASSRMMEQRWWYNISDLDPKEILKDGRSVYFFGNHGKAEEEDDLVGKSTPTGKIAILIRKEPEEVLDMIHEYLYEHYDDGTQVITLGYLENILATERYIDLMEYGKNMLYPYAHTPKIITPDRTPIIKELSPPYFGFRLMGQFIEITDHVTVMERMLADGIETEGIYAITDITDTCFTRNVNAKGKVSFKVTPEIDSPNNTFKVDTNYVSPDGVKTKTLRIKLGQDIPTRNTIAAVMGDDCKVYIITMKSNDRSFTFGSMIVTKDDVLFTSALSSNKIILVGG